MEFVRRTIKFVVFLLVTYSQYLFAIDYKLEDYVYESSVKSVLLFPQTGQNSDLYHVPVIPLSQPTPLTLQFDEIGEEFNTYYARIINCDANWNQSTVPELQYLSLYNEFNFNQYNYSLSTFEKYIHYTFNVPKVKISGNYVLVVYRDGNIENVVLTKRFIVTENLVNINLTMRVGIGDKRLTHQYPDFTITYPVFDIQNSNQVRVVIRQNGRWDNMKTNVKPLYIREVDKILDYRYYNNELAFNGGNEYRMFDIRSLRSKRMNIQTILLDGKTYEANVRTDTPRKNKPYILQYDLNGWYLVYKEETTDVAYDSTANRFRLNNQGFIQENTAAYDGDYSWINFTLKSDYKLDNPVYMFGKLTEWQILPKYQMTYNEKDKVYTLRAKFKQGFYNYEYVTLNPETKEIDQTMIEGNNSLASNYYEIFVYYTPFGSRAEHIIGYKYVLMN